MSLRQLPLRRILSAAGLILLALGSVDLFYFRFLTPQLLRSRPFYAALAYRQTPGLQQFMLEVRERTPPGARVAFWSRYQEWGRGYSFSHMRASYLVGGRYLLPLVTEEGPAPQTLLESDWIASWGDDRDFPGFERQWSGEDGVLWRRSR